MKKKKVAHCDGWYFDGVCPSRGETDVADIRYRQNGTLMRKRNICLSFGLNPMSDYDYCRHCVEIRKRFRAPRQKKTGPVIYQTPYQARTVDGKVVRAFKRQCDLTVFIKKNPGLEMVNIT